MRMECPVCQSDISLMSNEDQMHHVNRCLDTEESFLQSANKLATQNFDACPICFKESQCHMDHLKKCARQKSVFPKDLIHIIQRYEKENGTRVKNRKKPVASKAGKVAACKPQKQSRKVQQADADAEDIIPVKSEKAASSKSVHFNKVITAKNGRLTTYTDLPDRNHVQQKLETILAESTCLNLCHKSTPSPDTPLFDLSSLLHGHSFIARGFEPLVTKTIATHSKSCRMPLTPIKSGFIPESSVIEIDLTESFLQRLWQQKDKKSADLLIRTREKVDLACHSMLWCMNTGRSRLTRCGSMFRADCSTFSKDVVEIFISFCYTGRMRIESEMENEFRNFLNHFECQHLTNELTKQ